MKTIKNKTVLVTGASSGIGEAFAEYAASQGANLILTARSEDKLTKLADGLTKKYQVAVKVIAGDLSLPATPARLVQEIKASNLCVDLLINNAGVGRWGTFEGANFAVYQEMIQLNISSVVALTHLLIPEIVKNKGGIINVGSTGSFQPVPYISVYCATKAFVLSFSEALHQEYKRSGVAVLALCPGNTISQFQAVANANISGLRADTPERVAREGLKALLQGKSCHVVGTDNYIAAQLPRVLPRKCVTHLAAAMFRKRIPA